MVNANVLVIGNGAREHAICEKLAKSSSTTVDKIFITPGNGGISKIDRFITVKLDIETFQGLPEWCSENHIDLVIIGPEIPLAAGIVDCLQNNGITCFGPTQAAARIETDKKWSKQFMDKYGILTASWKSFDNSEDAKLFLKSGQIKDPFVIKAVGLAAGKGVIVTSNTEEASNSIDEIMSGKFGDAGKNVIVETRLYGKEVSALAFTDGDTLRLMPAVQDYKRLLENDEGPNTGGMGAYGPVPLPEAKYILEHVMKRVVDGMKTEGTPYIGVIYAGLMITDSNEIYTLEFNARFGDPETQILLTLLETDLYQICMACCKKSLSSLEISWNKNIQPVGIVIASQNYPHKPVTGLQISGLDEVLKMKDVAVFHSGVSYVDANYVTAGGRVLTVVATDGCLFNAAIKASYACSKINFSGAHYRRDIACRQIARQMLYSKSSLYAEAGVNIELADEYIKDVKGTIEAQFTSNVISRINAFGSVYDIHSLNYQHPYLVSSTDGVGTKLKIAIECSTHGCIGKDLVAMSVNDILCHGAKPLYFLDYIACNQLTPIIIKDVLNGIIEACKESDCTLVGGETAEMPSMYAKGDYDVAGFAVGIVEKNEILPRLDEINCQDVLIGVSSSGVHSNGISLVRKIVESNRYSYRNIAPFGNGTTTLGEEILKPTRIYVNELMPFIKKNRIKAIAHITGGGLIRNIPRVLPSDLTFVLDARNWPIPDIFPWLAAVGNVSLSEMLTTFNCGLGAVLVVDRKHADEMVSKIEGAAICGRIINKDRGKSEENCNKVLHFDNIMERKMSSFVTSIIDDRLKFYPKKRVAVFISGTGSNLQSLIQSTKHHHDAGAEIVLVISDKPKVGGLDIASQNNIHTEVVERAHYENKDAFEDKLNKILNDFSVELICLAGFMRILGKTFIENWRGNIINIHPSLLPSFKGKSAQRQALLAGVRITGCTVHFVEAEVDSGAIIDQEPLFINDNDTEATLIERIKEKEHILFPRVLKLVATGKVRLNTTNGKVVRIV